MSENYRNVLRYVGFVALNTAASAGLTYAALWEMSPQDRFLTIPAITVLAFATCLDLYPILRRQRTAARQLAAFYLAFITVTAGFGVYLSFFIGIVARGLMPSGALSPWESAENLAHGMLVGVAMGHLFGLIPFVALVLMNGALSPLWFPKNPRPCNK